MRFMSLYSVHLCIILLNSEFMETRFCTFEYEIIFQQHFLHILRNLELTCPNVSVFLEQYQIVMQQLV